MHYEIIKSGRRTMAIEVKPDGRVLLRIPYSVSEASALAFAEKKRAWILYHLEQMAARRREKEKRPPMSECEIARLRAEAKALLPELTRRWAERMGLTYESVRITSAEKRFGSCNKKKHICYSYRLMQYPMAAIEYVVVHELSHLREMNHSKNFYRIVETYLPDYRERQKLLRE